AGKPIRKSHENPAVQAIYKEFLGAPLSEKSHHLLHTTYTKRGLAKKC
ncbi:MAG: iron hydrogenase small subunit, partial [Candidatus Omnitrophota bacterium]